MAEEDSPPKGQPLETGVIPVQQPAPPAALAVIQPSGDVGPGIQPSPMARAFEEAAAFKTQAAQVFAARWADDVYGRLHRIEAELRETRRDRDEQRDRATRLDERLASIDLERSAQDRLKVLGGAVIGVGLPLIFDGKHVLGAACVLVGFVLAYGVPWWRHGK